MTSALNIQQVGIIDARADIRIFCGAVGKRAQHIDFGKSCGGHLDLRREGAGIIPQFGEQLGFQCQRLVLRSENLAFHFLEFRRDEPFRVDQCLFPYIIGRHGIQMTFGDFDKVSENAVVIDFQ